MADRRNDPKPASNRAGFLNKEGLDLARRRSSMIGTRV